MAIVTGDRYIDKLVKFVETNAGQLIDGTLVLKLNPAGLHYIQSRLESLHELESLLAGAPVDYLRAYVSDLGDHRALEQLRRILRLITSLKVVSVLPLPSRDPTPLSLLPFVRLKVLELRGCDLSTSSARGLLELRHTLEKIVCHNSTDALRHVFASRIAEIKDSPLWNKLSFVSCACNRLVLMDEALHLLPAVESLDLSRNRFTKLDNLRKCTKLKHLDLGFNHLRTISYFSEVSCHIVKLVLRNNALATLRGIEKLRSLEGLDVSYNIISNFSELEYLAGLPSLQSLWLEGNPLSCARWYRAQTFSYFSHPDRLKLDDIEISTKEFWKRQLIIARRQKRPSSFGFYSPAKYTGEDEGNINMRRTKVSRIASIESEDESTYFNSDPESGSCDNDVQSRDGDRISEDEAEIVELMNRVELMKKERSILWLREFKEWMDHATETYSDNSHYNGKENHLNNNEVQHPLGESSRYVSDSVQGDEISTNVLESDSKYFDHIGKLGIVGGVPLPGMDNKIDLRQENQLSHSHEGINQFFMHGKSSHPDKTEFTMSFSDDKTDSRSSSICHGSPPHYQKDILYRRQNLVEEILQLSAESYSVASSDSYTSSSNGDGENNTWIDFENSHDDQQLDRKNGLATTYENTRNPSDSGHTGEITGFADHKSNWLEQLKNRKIPRLNVISLFKEKNMVDEPNGNLDTFETYSEDVQRNGDLHMSNFQEDEQNWNDATPNSPKNDSERFCRQESLLSHEFIEEYFSKYVADSMIHETCSQYICCDCVLEGESVFRERQAVLILSTRDKLYVLVVGDISEGTGTALSLVGTHSIEDVKEVLFGVGLQLLRVCFKGCSYLFITRDVEKSRQLLNTLRISDSCDTKDKCSFRSLEQVQVQLFENQICGRLKFSMFQYSMVLFCHDCDKGNMWLSRSLFVIGGHLLVCKEDLRLFGFISQDSLSPYFTLDSSCLITDVSEMVIEPRGGHCLTLFLEHASSTFCPSSKTNKLKISSTPIRWKMKWFSDDAMLKFMSLLEVWSKSLVSSVFFY
ncbi:hypothetical protein ACFE04_005415 [Oxalis oulophora]